jgi:hypothetical protein
MADRTPYRRIGPRERDWFWYYELWLGPDHLLQLRSSRFTEEYQRFLYKDIQAITVTETSRYPAWQIAWLALSAALLIAANVIPEFALTRGLASIPPAVSLLFALRDVIRGPRCITMLYTAVSAEPLRAIARTRVAARAVARLKEEIEAVQGVWQGEAPAPLSPLFHAETPERVLREPALSRVYLLLFGVLHLDAWISVSGLFLKRWNETFGISLSAAMAEVALAVLLLRRTPRATRSHFRYWCVAVAAVLLCIDWMLSLGLISQAFAKAMEAAKNKQEFDPNAFESLPWFLPAVRFAIFWRLFVSMAGFGGALIARGKPQ